MMPNYTVDDLRASVKELAAILDLPFWEELANLEMEPQDQDSIDGTKFLDFNEELLQNKVTLWSQWMETEKILKQFLGEYQMGDQAVSNPKLAGPSQNLAHQSFVDALKGSIEFKVAGSSFITQPKTVLKAPKSQLADVMKTIHKQGQQLENIDRDPERFRMVINFLRDDFKIPMALPTLELDELIGELKFWKIPLMKPSLQKDIDAVFSRDPSLDYDLCHIPLAKWRKLKPLTVAQILVKRPRACIYNYRVLSKEFEDCKRTGQIEPESGSLIGCGRRIFKGKILEGFFDHGKNGWFRVIWPKGDYYVGNWEAGKKNGFGKYVDPKGNVQEGKWVDNKFKE